MYAQDLKSNNVRNLMLAVNDGAVRYGVWGSHFPAGTYRPQLNVSYAVMSYEVREALVRRDLFDVF